MPKVRSPIWKKKSPAGDVPPIRRIEVSMRAVYPDITTCTNYRSFMKDWLRFMRRLNKKPEADLKEEFAVAAQSTNPSLWDHLVTSRTMTPELLPRVIRAMELESGEAEYFTLLVRHFQAERARQRATQRQERALGAHRAATASLLLLRTQVAQQPWDRKLHQALKTAEKREKNCLILLESSTELTCAATGALEAADSDRRAWLEVNQAKLLATNAGDYCTHWYIPALQALIECTGFQNDPTWIAHKLKGRVGEQEVMHGLRVLRDMKLIEEKNQRLVPTSSLLLTTDSVQKFGTRRYHQYMIHRAGEQLHALEARDPELALSRFYGATLSVSLTAEIHTQIEAELLATYKRILALVSLCPNERSQVIQVNLQMFPLSLRTTAGPPNRGE